MKKLVVFSIVVTALLVLSLYGVAPVDRSTAAVLPASTPVRHPATQNGIPNIGAYNCSSTKPCPMGLVDYGVNGKTDYSYTAIETESWVNFTKLTIGKASNGLNHKMDVQQNTVAYNIYEDGISGEYWIQDVPQITQSGTSYKVTAEDNVWNFSTATAIMGGTVTGNLLNDCSGGKGSGNEFYYCYADQTYTTTLPFEIEMVEITGVDNTFAGHSGASAVEFEFGVYHNGVLLSSSLVAYDWVDFNTNSAPTAPQIHVGGFNPFSYNDYETLVAGPNGGSSVKMTDIAATFSAYYAPSSYGVFVTVPHAWSAGSDTAETASNVHMTGSGTTGIASKGADNNVQLF